MKVIDGCEIYLDVPTPNGNRKRKAGAFQPDHWDQAQQRQLASDLLARDTRLDPAELMNHPEMRQSWRDLVR